MVGQARTGVLVIRIWIEPDPGGEIRARITEAQGMTDGDWTSASAAGADAVVARVREWVEAFAAHEDRSDRP